jgi:hypothetical protein
MVSINITFTIIPLLKHVCSDPKQTAVEVSTEPAPITGSSV